MAARPSLMLAMALPSLVCALGCGGESVLLDLPENQTAAQPCDVGKQLTFTPLDDFESTSDANFNYYANPDDPSGKTITDPPGADPNAAGLQEVDRCPGSPQASVYALHVSGSGYVTYGPNLGWTIGNSSDEARDYSGQSGVAFWARTDSTEPQVITLTLNDVYTFPVDDVASRHCVLATPDTPPPSAGTGCWNGGQTTRSLSNNWRLYTADFSEFTEQTWGAQSPGGRPDLKHLLSIEFHFPVAASFDLWIDDISLFKR
ncbi:MAG TPA: hypothetical protein VHB79_07780 [Polyangiaceae bacterium]|nr:hypothetical protein [Polyangiaceae bacterium]